MKDNFMDEHTKLVMALKEALNDNSGNGVMLIQRIPLICKDINDIRNDMRWMKWLGSGFVTAAGLLALKSLGL